VKKRKIIGISAIMTKGPPPSPKAPGMTPSGRRLMIGISKKKMVTWHLLVNPIEKAC
jgi:hypothetical protein